MEALEVCTSQRKIFYAHKKRLNAYVGRKTFRGSVFRGISKNKQKWQVCTIYSKINLFINRS